MWVRIYKAGLWCIPPPSEPTPALAQKHRSRHNFNRARGSGLGPRRLAPRECAARRSFNSGSRPPAAPGPARQPPGRDSQFAPFVPLHCPRPDLRTGRRGRTTHVSSKCCSKVASIPPAVHPTQDSAGRHFLLQHWPPALLALVTPAGRGRTAPPKGQTSRRSLRAVYRKRSVGSRAARCSRPGGAGRAAGERPTAGPRSVGSRSIGHCARDVILGFRFSRLRNVGQILY